MSQLPREPPGLHHRPPSHAGHPQLGRRCPAPAHHPAPTGAPLTPRRGAAPRCPPPPLADARLPRQRRSAVPRPRGRSVCHPPDARLPARGPCSRAGRGGGGRRSPPARRGPGSGAPQRRRHQVSGTASRRPGRSGAAPRLPELPLSPSPFPIAARTEPKPGRKLPRWPQQWGEGGESPPGPVRCAPRPDRAGCRPAAGPRRPPGKGTRTPALSTSGNAGGRGRGAERDAAARLSPRSRLTGSFNGRGLPDPGQEGQEEAVCCHPPWPAGGSEPAPHLPESLR